MDKAGDSCPEGCGFKYWIDILYICCKILYRLVETHRTKRKNMPGMAHLKKSHILGPVFFCRFRITVKTASCAFLFQIFKSYFSFWHQRLK